jgi:hypothetical protein
MNAVQLHNECDHRGGSLLLAVPGAAAIQQATVPGLRVTGDPLVSGFATDCETPSQSGEGFAIFQRGLNQTQTIFGWGDGAHSAPHHASVKSPTEGLAVPAKDAKL